MAPARAFEVRPARPDDAEELALLYAAVAAERIYIGGEPPVDLERRAELFRRGDGGQFVAVAGEEIVGQIAVLPANRGVGELGMMVADGWRSRGVGSALMEAALAWSREQELHKLTLEVWPHNEAAIALYRKFGFVEEGRRVKHHRRANGELWDSILMGLPLG